jgi:hypothetical protein
MNNFNASVQQQIEEFNENITHEKINTKLKSGDQAISPLRVLEYISQNYSGLWSCIEKLAIANFLTPVWDKSIFVPTFFWLPELLEIRHPKWHNGYKGKNAPTWGIDFFSMPQLKVLKSCVHYVKDKLRHFIMVSLRVTCI